MNRVRKPTTRRVRRPAAQRPTEKPEVRVVEMSDGSLRIINGGIAAKFCGVKPQSFAAYLRRHYKSRRHPVTVSIAQRIRTVYPELFKENN